MRRLLFAILILGSSCSKMFKYKIVALQPFENLSAEEIQTVRDSIQYTFDCKIIILPIKKVPNQYITRIKSFRYRADSILNFLDKIKPDSVDIMLGLTETDISITKKDKITGKTKLPISKYTDWAIFGLGRVNGHSCVVSKKRLHSNVSNHTYLKRLTRICNHEVGHVFGLRHCPTKKCLMNDANETIKTIDKSSGKLCKSCQNKIF